MTPNKKNILTQYNYTTFLLYYSGILPTMLWNIEKKSNLSR